MKTSQGFASGLAALGVALMLAPAASWSFDSGSAPSSAPQSAPASAPEHKPRHGARRTPHVAPSSQATQDRPLALQAPPIDHVLDREKLRYILADSGETDDSDAQSVSVHDTKAPIVVPRGQLYALPWAFMHPTQAWRIFMPVPQQ